MLVARKENGEWFSLVNKTDRHQLLVERRLNTFYCPVCQEKLILKLGEKNCFHFAHFKESNCHIQSEPETLPHIQGKKDFYDWLKSQDHRPILEMYLSSIRQRADVGLPRFPHPLAFEFQCSTIPPTDLLERDIGYRTQNVLPLWIWNQSRLKKLGEHHYNISPLEWLTYRFPFSHLPHSRHQRQKGFLTFYNPENKLLTFLYHLIPLNSRKLWAESLTLPLLDLSLQDLITPHLNMTTKSVWYSAWLNQKKKWRTSRILRSHCFEWDLQRLSEKKGVVWKAFPSIVGNPLGDDGIIETDSYIWQGWLCLQFLLHKNRGVPLHVHSLKQAFMTLIEKHWVILRRPDRLEEAWNLVLAYLEGLAALNFLKKIGAKEYVIKESLHWGNPFFEELLEEDARVLLQWDRLVKQ